MTKLELMADLEERLRIADITPELRKSATQLVMGSGNLDADIVFIGEAPGKKEDEYGVPFIGASGKFLDTMLDSVNLQRDDIYITNIVKYRPPNNRDPTTDEKRVFLPYLLEQLQIIHPKIVVTLGRHSMEYFLPGRHISEIHGQAVTIPLGNSTVTLVPLYHPAAALYNGKLRQTLLDDFGHIPETVKQLSK